MLQYRIAEGQHKVTVVGPFLFPARPTMLAFVGEARKPPLFRKEVAVAEVIAIIALLLAVPSAVESTKRLIEEFKRKKHR